VKRNVSNIFLLSVLLLVHAVRRLAAQLDVVGVIIGSIVGHAACTGAAVLGGKHLAEHIDEKLVGVSGGALE
jgi:putative Ca2+/H+ antiporter (TMEM165/GDT1 family)